MSLASFLRADAIADLLRASGIDATDVRVTWVRDDRPVSVFAAIDFRSGEARYDGYVRAHDGDRSAVLVDKWRRLRRVDTPIGPGVRSLMDPRVALFLFPNDAGLRDLRWVADVKKLKRTLTTAEAIGGRGLRVSGKQSRFTRVRYKPERRYIARGELALRDDEGEGDETLDVYLRFFPDERGERTARIMRALHRSAAAACVPEPLGTFMDGRLYVERTVPGDPITQAIVEGRANPKAVADCLLALRHATLDDVPERSPSALLHHARRDAERIGADALAVLARLAQRPPAPPETPRVVHGDVHPAQFIAEAARVRLVDWERAGVGDPMLDVGRLAAELDVLAIEAAEGAEAIRAFRDAVIDRYCRTSGEGTARLSFYRACALLGLAAIPHRHGTADADARAARIVAVADEHAHRFAPSWRILYPRRNAPWSVRTGDGHATFDPATRTFTVVDPMADATLPDLATALDAGDLVSYRANRRAVVRARDGGGAWTKVLPRKKAEKARRKLDALHRATADRTAPFPLLPTPIDRGADRGTDRDAGTITFRHIPGRSLRAWLMDGADLAAAIGSVADSLVAFHGTAADDSLPAVAWPDLRDWLAYARAIDPDFARQAASVYHGNETLFAANPPPADTLAHGDLHDDNILLTDERVALIDIDAIGRGDATEDVGNLAAHLALAVFKRRLDADVARRDRDTLIDAYRGRGGAISRDAALAAGARALLRIAVVYALRAEWRGVADRLLREAARWSRP